MPEELVKELREIFQNEEARYGYAEAFLNAHVASQLKALRGQREMSQQELANVIGTKQSGISRLENVNYSTWKVETLRKLARAFGLWLDIDFREFGELPPRVESFRERTLQRRKFEDDPAFNDSINRETPLVVIGAGAEEAQREPTQIPTDTNTHAELLSRQRPRQPVGSEVFFSGGAAQTATAARLG